MHTLSPSRRLSLTFAIAFSACGARTPLDVTPTDAATASDASVRCSSLLPAGAVQWRTTLTQQRALSGPLAASVDDTTYFAWDPALVGLPRMGPPALYALDRCGGVRWRSGWEHFQNRSVMVHALISNGNLIVGDGDLQSFDAATGLHRWTVDLVGLAHSVSLGDVSGSNALRRLVADRVGDVYAMIQSRELLGVVRVSSDGVARLVFRAPINAGVSNVTDMVIDSAGHLVFAVTDTNVSPGPGVLYAFRRDGAPVYALRLPEVNYQDHLSVGDGFVVLGDTGTFVSNEGRVLRSLGAFTGPAAIATDGTIYTLLRRSGDDAGMQSFDATDALRWSAPLRGGYAFSYEGGPLLGWGNVYSMYYRSSSLADGGVASAAVLQSVHHYFRASATYEFAGQWQGRALLLSTGFVVFALDGSVLSVSTGGDAAPLDVFWETPHGANDQRGAPHGQ